MGPIDELELDVLERSGDPELAEQVGDAARRAVTQTADSLAAVLGVDPRGLLESVERALLLCDSFTVDNAIVEVDDDG